MPKWIDLSDKSSGARLRVSRIESNTYLFITGLSNKSPKWAAAIDTLGFVSGGSGRFLIRRVQPGERPSPVEFRPVWPSARVVDMQPQEYLLDLAPRKKTQDTEDRQIVDQTRNARRLGRNAQAEEVYDSDLGRFIWRERVGAVYEGPSVLPAQVLRAPDEVSLAQCADGFVQSMRQGEVQHSEDFEAFREAVGRPADEQSRSRLHAAIDAAVVRYLRQEFDTAQDAYGESVRLYEMLPPYAGAARGRAAMPAPLSVIAQRLLGDTTGKRVVYPQAFDGAAFAFLPKGTFISAFQGGRDLSDDARGLVDLRAEDVQWGEEFQAARNAGSDALFLNIDPKMDAAGQREDLRQALSACRALGDGGRAVLVLAGDDARQPGTMHLAFRNFLRTASQRYTVEECFELHGNLAQRVGTSAPLRVLTLRNAAASQESMQQWEDVQRLDVLHSWDEVKARVDEALARARVEEARSDSISIERAAEVNRLQAPYLAFSRVGEARTMVPKNLQAPMQAALADVEEQYGPVDNFVEQELGLGGVNTLADRFSPEQVDGIALMLARMKRRRAPILADETGVGKGRILAALATWASKQSRTVVFLTDRANLFSDLARDLRDIGEWGRFRPLITNSDGHIVEMVRPSAAMQQAQEAQEAQETQQLQQAQEGQEPPDQQPQQLNAAAPQEPAARAAATAPAEFNVLVKATPAAQMAEIMTGNLSLQDLGVNIVFTTYSQIASENSDKALWIKNQLPDALLVVDEAHIAAGSDSSIARQVVEMSSLAWNVVFSSATWAKTPDNLHVYARALPESVNMASLTETIRRGGDAFSEVFSTMLARDGALIRREHDLSRLEFVLEIDAANLERNRQVADLVSTAMGQLSIVSGDVDRMMVRMSRASIDALKAARDVRMAAVGRGARGRIALGADGETAAIFRSAFGAGSMLYQVQRRMNAALNVDNVVRLALRALEEGRKPVIVFDETTESFVRRALERTQPFDAQGNAQRTDTIVIPTLRDLMHKLVEDLSTVRVSEVTWEEVQAAQAAGRDLVQEAEQEAVLDNEAAVEAQAQAGEAGANGVDVVNEVAAPQDVPADQVAQTNQGTDLAPEPLVAEDDARTAQDVNQEGEPPAQAQRAQQEVVDVEQAIEAAAAAGRETTTVAPKRRKAPVRRIRLDQLPGLSEQQKRTFADGLRVVQSCIEQIPLIPISVADEVHRRLREAGLRTGEISGRSFMLENVGNGMAVLRSRKKSKLDVNRTVDGFNSFDLDAVVINRSAATGLSLHASPRFVDHRRRELIEAQPPENPTERVQLYGRVNRYDQVSQPRVSIAATGIPGETRHLMMQNKKLAALNANVRSSRESHAIISTVIDLLNPIGREVCRQFFIDNPAYATRMAQDVGRIERNEVDAASAFTRYVSLLTVQQQDMLYEQVNQLFEEAVLRAELAGENPLKPKEHEWRARTVAQDVLFGIDHGGLGSAFDGPVYIQALSYEKELRPMSWEEIQANIGQARRRLIESGHAVQVGTLLNESRDPIISLQDVSKKVALQLDMLARTALASTKFATTDEAMNAVGANPVKRGMARKLWLEQHLPKMVPGARIGLPHPNDKWLGATVPHVLVDLIAPKPGKEGLLSQWRLMLLAPGQERPAPHSLNSLMTKVELRVDQDRVDRTGQIQLYGDCPVRVGTDIMMVAHERRLTTAQNAFEVADRLRNQSSAFYERLLVDSFRNAPRGKRTRWASVLAGNMYLASEFASQAKVGQSVLYTDDRGMRQRAIVLSAQFEAAKLRFMPVRIWVRRAMEDLLLALSGLSADRMQRDEEGNEVPGEPPCEPNGPNVSQGPSFLLHTSFARAWSYGTGATSRVHAPDDLLIVPGKGISMLVTKEQHRRIAASMRAAQDRIRNEEAERLAQNAQAGQTGQTVPTAQGPANVNLQPPVGEMQAGAAENPQPAVAEVPATRPGPARGRTTARTRMRAADDPSHVVISAADKAKRGERQGKVEAIVLKAETPAKMRRAIRLLVEGAGLQLYAQRSSAVGAFARDLVRADLIRRLRDEIGDNPQKLARLEEQIERMDTEAAATRRGFVDLANRGLGRAEADVLVERDGQIMTEQDLFTEEERETAEAAQAEQAQNATQENNQEAEALAQTVEPEEQEPDQRARLRAA
jgi:hypothetical protein